MDRLLTALFLLVVATGASAQNLPAIDFTCPNDIRVQAEAGGPVTINGKQATLHKFSEQYFEAKNAVVTISVSLDDSGSPTASYTGKHGVNGVCSATPETTEAQPQ
ncbi:hypothetical protein IB229_09500 [Pseudomonas sp. PDM14]|uniref:hypothetical protein n=1 Tax=Pseudomonas sp. PDM14 TaxID=2769288 RepID=UPI0017866250|nr:hypothetical protein [Pseudomonas sp. PDM14]MBD9483206.1 hypothetical protein [Pseudomonas sp. PDM14]